MPALFNSGQPFEMIFVTVFICIFFGVVWVILDSELRRCLREWVLMFSVRLSSLMLRTRIKEYNKGFILGSCSEMLDWPRPGRRRRCCWCCWRCSCLHDIVLCSRFWWNFLPSACSIISRWTVSLKIGGSFVRPSLGPSHLRHCPQNEIIAMQSTILADKNKFNIGCFKIIGRWSDVRAEVSMFLL